MKKNELMQSIKVIILGLVFGLGVIYVSAATSSTWVPAAGTPPSNNVAGPLNVGPSTQTKEGSLIISAGGFRSAGPALLNDVVVIGLAPLGQQQLPTQETSFNSQNEKSKGLFAKMSDFFGFSNSLETQKAYAEETETYSNCFVPNFCVSSSECSSQGGTSGVSCITSAGQITSLKCCSTTPSNGVCGPTHTSTLTYSTAPTTGLCSSGNPTVVTGSAPNINYWKWGCNGINGGTSTSSTACNADKTPVVWGICGSAVGDTFPSAPTTNLCSSGTPTVVTGSAPDLGYWKWGCDGSGGGGSTTSTACTANRPAVISGSCGSADGETFSSLTSSSANLCSAGTVASFAGNGPWTWGCNGSGGGTSTSATACSASKTVQPPPATKLTVYGSSSLFGALSVDGNITSNNKLVCLQDGTNCPTQAPAPTGGTSLWNITTSPNIETALNGSVKITGGTLNLGTGNYVLNTGTSVLKALKLDNGGSLTSPDLSGGGILSLGNKSSNPDSTLTFMDDSIVLRTAENNGFLMLSNNGNVYIGPTTSTTSDIPAVKLDVSGGIRINSTGTRPDCNFHVRGTFWLAQNTTPLPDVLYVCMKSQDTYYWSSISHSSYGY